MNDHRIDHVLGAIRQYVETVANPFLDDTVHHNDDPFLVLAACILSLRNKDELTAVKAPELFRLADTPEAMLRLEEAAIARTIYPVGFYRNKARTLREISRTLLEKYGGRVPDTVEELVKIKGIGRKTANLVVSVAYHKPAICVDTHVHRIMNRLGYVRTRRPDDTEKALRAKLPRKHWIKVNNLLVRFGKSVCTPVSPKCSICPVSTDCDKVGVERSR